MIMRVLSILALMLLVSAPARAQTYFGAGFPVHGNWCGIGSSGGWQSFPPVDQLDESCMRHDICTAQWGVLNCGCDIAFMQDLRLQRWPHPGMEEKARAIYEAIAMLPCDDPSGQQVKMEMVMRDWTDGIASGRETPWEVFLRLGRLGMHGFDRAMRENW